MPELSSIRKEFFDYLVTNSLTNLLGFQVLIDDINQTM